MQDQACDTLRESLQKSKMNEKISGENVMEDNGGLNANTAATLALLADTTRAGRGGMYGGGYGR